MRREYENGFTLVELLVAIGIAIVVMAGVYSVYYSQQKSYIVQEQIVATQQNLRAGMTLLSMDIMSAGYDPTNTMNTSLDTGGECTDNTLKFTHVDISGTTMTLETILWGIDTIGGIPNVLYRELNAGSRLPVAENIDALNFIYLDADGNEVTVPANMVNVRSIQVTMVARTGRGDPGYVDNASYTNKKGDTIFGPAGDNFRRRALTREIQCRNLP